MTRVYGFNEDGFRRVQEATRRTLGSALTGSQRRRQPPVLSGGSSRTIIEDEFPDGSGGCNCNDCIQGIDLPGEPTVCCKGALIFEGTIWPPGVTHVLKYRPDDEWGTHPDGFTEPEETCESGSPNKYRWARTPSHTLGEDTVRLELVEDNGCPVKCIVYKSTRRLLCPCPQEFELAEWSGIGVDNLPCKIRLCPRVPQMPVAGGCALSTFEDCIPGISGLQLWQVDVPDYTDGTFTDCDQVAGRYYLSWADMTTWDETGIEWRKCVDVVIERIDVPEVHKQVQIILKLWCSLSQFDTPQSMQLALSLLDPGCGSAYSGNLLSATVVFADGCSAGEATLEFPAVVGTPGGESCEVASPPALATVTPLFEDSLVPATESGSCDGPCEPPAAPEDTDPGCCCYNSVAFWYWDEETCTEFGGLWNEDCSSETSDDFCVLAGVCCVYDPEVGNYCVPDMTAAQCQLISNSIEGGGATLAPDGDCETDCFGACCLPDESCEVLSETECSNEGGYWLGAGTDCTDKNCTLGCCCYNNSGTCVMEDMSYEECADAADPYGFEFDPPNCLLSGPACGDGANDGDPNPDGSCFIF